MQGDGYAEGIAIRPAFFRCERVQAFRRLKGRAAIVRAGLCGGPVREHRVTEEFVDRPRAAVHQVARLAKPRADQLRKITTGHFLGHRAEAANVADEQRHGPRIGDRGIRRADHRCLVVLVALSAAFGIFGEYDDVVRDPDARGIFERHRHDDTLVVHISAVAAAEIDELKLPAIVAADDGVLAGDLRAEVQANGVFARAPDGGRIPDRHLEGRGAGRLDLEFGTHAATGCRKRTSGESSKRISESRNPQHIPNV